MLNLMERMYRNNLNNYLLCFVNLNIEKHFSFLFFQYTDPHSNISSNLYLKNSSVFFAQIGLET